MPYVGRILNRLECLAVLIFENDPTTKSNASREAGGISG
jgi:hypothetical protein